ncbi:MAG: SMC-Scp complex subunit ScpB [Pirellulaceae bacterium]|nr:SMC-Scp complex subunit ScpB [Pirellulaceae bacterium]
MDSNQHEEDDDEQGLSLEELSQTYAQLLNKGGPSEQTTADVDVHSAAEAETESFDPLEEELAESDTCPVTPTSILEAVLFVGRPDNSPISADEIAGLMRGVKPAEIETHVAELNQVYAETGRAFRIATIGNGFRLQIADDLQFIRDRFYGPIREIRLNQAAIDCLALIAYQPGISREQLEEQRGQPSGGVLSQLVRRQLIEIRREGQKQRQLHYYPTDKLLQLIGLGTLEDLPQVEEWQT